MRFPVPRESLNLPSILKENIVPTGGCPGVVALVPVRPFTEISASPSAFIVPSNTNELGFPTTPNNPVKTPSFTFAENCHSYPGASAVGLQRAVPSHFPSKRCTSDAVARAVEGLSAAERRTSGSAESAAILDTAPAVCLANFTLQFCRSSRIAVPCAPSNRPPILNENLALGGLKLRVVMPFAETSKVPSGSTLPS